jgi:flagellar protein FlaG
VREAVSTTNEVVKAVQSRLQFVADDSSGQMVVRVMDSESNEVIRQIPSEEMLAISQAIERMQGLLVQGEA